MRIETLETPAGCLLVMGKKLSVFGSALGKRSGTQRETYIASRYWTPNGTWSVFQRDAQVFPTVEAAEKFLEQNRQAMTDKSC